MSSDKEFDISEREEYKFDRHLEIKLKNGMNVTENKLYKAMRERK